MIYLAMDVCYHQTNNCAFAAGVRFTGVENVQTLSTHGTWVNEVLAYQSGQFYKREMPCLLALLKTINDPVDILVIDGFVYLNQGKSGLGKHLYDNLTDKKPIIGIAKNPYQDMDNCHQVFRGQSKKPLYVTTVDYSLENAKQWLKNLQGSYRLPDILTQVDKLSRKFSI